MKNKINIICRICGNRFQNWYSNHRKFCSLKCYYKWRSKYYRGKSNPAWKGGKTKVICKECKKEFYITPSVIKKGKGKFCSQKCVCKWRSENMIGKNAPCWKGGISKLPYSFEFNKQLKKQIRKRDNYTCQECGFHQELLKEKLSIHHIDYNKQNNNPENLISLCNSCHSQTNFSRNDWRKYFQNKRTLTVRGVNTGQ